MLKVALISGLIYLCWFILTYSSEYQAGLDTAKNGRLMIRRENTWRRLFSPRYRAGYRKAGKTSPTSHTKKQIQQEKKGDKKIRKTNRRNKSNTKH